MSWKPQTMATQPAHAWMTTLRTPLGGTLFAHVDPANCIVFKVGT